MSRRLISHENKQHLDSCGVATSAYAALAKKIQKEKKPQMFSKGRLAGCKF
jgi:hypothetical protein